MRSGKNLIDSFRGFGRKTPITESMDGIVGARAIAAFALMLFIYRLPSKIKADFINWLGGSALAAIGIFLVGSEFTTAFSILLLSVFFPAYFNK